MALKSTYAAEEKGAEIEESLDQLDKVVERVKVLYEQYFMGIQKQAPSHLHTEVERRLRELTQRQIRNTALRFRLVTIQQKFGSYNTYWKRTMREMESGSHLRQLSRLRRQAAMTGEEIPDEILARMPKRMRDAIARDRAAALAKAEREGKLVGLDSPYVDEVDDDQTQPDVANVHPPGTGAALDGRGARDPRGPHRLDPDALSDDDLSATLAALADQALAAVERPARPARVPSPITDEPSSERPAVIVSPAPPRPARAARPASDTIPTPPGQPAPGAATARPRSDTVPNQPGPASPPRPARAPTAQPARPAAARPPPVPSRDAAFGIPGMSEADTRALYAKYRKARDVVGDRSEMMSYDRLVRTLASQAPRIIEAHKASAVQFDVVIKDNKVVLKARPR